MLVRGHSTPSTILINPDTVQSGSNHRRRTPRTAFAIWLLDDAAPGASPSYSALYLYNRSHDRQQTIACSVERNCCRRQLGPQGGTGCLKWFRYHVGKISDFQAAKPRSAPKTAPKFQSQGCCLVVLVQRHVFPYPSRTIRHFAIHETPDRNCSSMLKMKPRIRHWGSDVTHRGSTCSFTLHNDTTLIIHSLNPER